MSASNPSQLSTTDREMIMELVAKISSPAEVLARYGVTAQQFALRCRSPIFLSAYREIKRAYLSDLNASERVRKTAAFLLEDMVVDLTKAAKSSESANVKRDTVEALAKISDNWEPGKNKKDGGQVQQVKININFGGNRRTFEGEAVAHPPAIEASTDG